MLDGALPLLEFLPYDPCFLLGPEDTEVIASLWDRHDCHQPLKTR